MEERNCKNCRFRDGSSDRVFCSRCVCELGMVAPTMWKERTTAQKLEDDMMRSNKSGKRLIGDLTNGYLYIDADEATKLIFGTNNGGNSNLKNDINSYYEQMLCKFDYKGGYNMKPEIKTVKFSGPCTIVIWSDGDKTIVRCEGEDFDKEKGLAMAICKKMLGTNKSKSNFNDIFKKWCEEETSVEEKKVSEPIAHVDPEEEIKHGYLNTDDAAAKFKVAPHTIANWCAKKKIKGAIKFKSRWYIPVTSKRPR